ncbi:MAG: 4-(cytidine 5'-diphospho)-2-C-methyl-D-erythritol kinase [Lachnospiraceae bacterium]|nr:4-(cytidine 5'-diphospho)-2-C-methyl-D-erythritol kinase [Lachnospiraceae bacterium]
MNQITIKAPAKINLTLDVTGRRDNGYHDLRMIMQTIDLCDTLTISRAEHTDTISFSMNKELPDGCPTEKNLVYRAATILKEQYGLSGGMEIYLEKNIPAAAGLAGGSSDCAATLSGINTLYDLGLSTEELCKIGVSLGADVPFCIRKGTMLAEGIGEILTPLTPLPPLWVLLVKPDISVSTAYVYQHLNLQTLTEHPDTEAVIRALDCHDAAAVAHGLSNVLETVTIPEYPALSQIKDFLAEQHAVGVLMSGSGPTTYGLYQDEIAARMALRNARNAYPEYDIILCQTKLPE